MRRFCAAAALALAAMLAQAPAVAQAQAPSKLPALSPAARPAIAPPPIDHATVPPPVTLKPGRAPSSAASPVGPVKVGVYLYSVQDLDFSKYTFHPTFEVWFRWRGDAFDPLANLHVVGARTTTITPEDRRRLADGENYVVARVDAVINETFDTGAFPFDQHRLAIAIESPFEDDYVVYDVDHEASMLDPAAFSPGWRLVGFNVREMRKQYPTSFGLTERSGDRYSTLVAEVVAQRIGWRVAVDYFIGFIVCVLLCLLGYFIPVNLLAARTTLLTAATIAAVGNKYVINSLAETNVTARLVNVAVISAFAMVLIYMLASVRCERIAESGHRARADRLNRNIGVGSAIVYVLVMTFVFWNALVAVPT
jgi:hypothetical protein